jgi:hypothetical protein
MSPVGLRSMTGTDHEADAEVVSGRADGDGSGSGDKE